jgi:hypothetical protein
MPAVIAEAHQALSLGWKVEMRCSCAIQLLTVVDIAIYAMEVGIDIH